MDTNIIRMDAEIRNFLEAEIEAGGIAESVAREALSDELDDIIEWFHGLAEHGCISGWVGKLVWYTDTHAFFDEHYAEIEDIREQYEDNIGEALRINGDLKNFLAWFSFEETAYRMAEEMGLT